MNNKALHLVFKRIMLVQLFIFSITTNYSQSFEWLITGGGPLSDKATSVAVDANGNTFITGYFNEEGTFGSITIPMINPSSKEVFIAKIDPDGNYLWVKSGNIFFDDRGLGLCLDPQGNVFVTGTCWGGLIFGSLNVYNNSGYTDQIYVLKLDTDGNEIWLKNAGVNEPGYPYNDDHGYDLVSDSNGDILVTGFVSNNDPFDHMAYFDAIAVPVAAMDSMAFVAKLSNAGVWQWVKTNGGIDSYRDNRITVDDENNVYVAGGFQETVTFETTTLTSYGLSDIYVTKYSPTGEFLYAVQAGSYLDDRANDIAFDHENHLYVTGEFNAEAAFGTDTIDNNGGDDDRDIFVARISKEGVWDWAKKAGSDGGGDRGNGVAVNQVGNIFVTGQFKGKAKFGGTLELEGETDSVQMFVAAIDSLGKWRWAMEGGGADYDRGNGIACDDDCNVYVDGYYATTFDFESGTITSTGKKDVFTLKLSEACFTYEPEVTPPTLTHSVNIPTGFSPNGDGLNETLKPIVGTDVKSFILSIYDRWGNRILLSSDPNLSWDGTVNGQTLNTGAYAFMLEIIYKDNATELKSGNITIIR